ncbi:MAG: Hsp70 family protein, partial [Waterburya sp.]
MPDLEGARFCTPPQTPLFYKVMQDSNGNVKLNCPASSKQFAPEEVSAEVLRKLAD